VTESIGPVAASLGATPRMLRYRESLGLLRPRRQGAGRRRYGPRDLAAAALGAELEQRYRVAPKTLAFALRLLADPAVAADVARLAALTGRPDSPVIAALDFEAAKARRLLAAPGAAPASAVRSGGSVARRSGV
jgi:MerR family copper efflux transcriptional regulator